MDRSRALRIPAGVRGVVVLDSGAVTSLAEQDPIARALWRRLTELGWRTAVPAVTLAEATTGRPGPDAPTNRLIRQVGHTILCDERLGRAAGVLRTAALARRSGASGIDAIVAAVAEANAPSIVLTTDPDDLEILLAHRSQPGHRRLS